MKIQKIIIVTQDEESARQFGFTKHEQFVFTKEIELKKTTKIESYKNPSKTRQ